MFAVGFIKQVINARAEFHRLVQPVGRIRGEDGEPRAAIKIFTHDVPFVNRDAMLAADQTQQTGTAPVAAFPCPRRASSGGICGNG